MPTYLSQTKSGIISSHGSRLPNGLACSGLYWPFFFFCHQRLKYLLGLLFNFFDFWSLLQIFDSVASSTHRPQQIAKKHKMCNQFIILIVSELFNILAIDLIKPELATLLWIALLRRIAPMAVLKRLYTNTKVGSTYGLRHQTKASKLDFNFLLTSTTLYSGGKAQNNCPIWRWCSRERCAQCFQPNYEGGRANISFEKIQTSSLLYIEEIAKCR